MFWVACENCYIRSWLPVFVCRSFLREDPLKSTAVRQWHRYLCVTGLSHPSIQELHNFKLLGKVSVLSIVVPRMLDIKVCKEPCPEYTNDRYLNHPSKQSHIQCHKLSVGLEKYIFIGLQ